MKDSVAYCGLFCESCGIYIATINNDEKEIERIAEMMKTTKEEIVCKGCRSEVLSPHCRNCEFKECAKGNGYDYCEECNEFPCNKLKDFQKQLPHRAELFESAILRKTLGIDGWLKKMTKDYSCRVCGSINSPYYISCKKCGNNPGNDFIKRNINLLKK